MSDRTDAALATDLLAGFWRRFGAFVVDCMVLGAVGWVAGLFLADQFVQLGPWGRLVGVGVAWPYFGLLNSRVGGGQTLGKRVLDIKVVGATGECLSVSRSLVRFVPLGAAWFLNGAPYSSDTLMSGWTYLVSFAVFGIGLSLLYLFVFNRGTRRSLHDLLVGSWVVRSGSALDERVQAPPLWRVHVIICGVLMAGSLIAAYFGQRAGGSDFFGPLFKIQQAVCATSWVTHAQVSQGQSVMTSSERGKTTTTYLNIVAYIQDADLNNAERAHHLAELALSVDPEARQLDVINVVLAYGYDIGIASAWQSRNFALPPAEWLTK